MVSTPVKATRHVLGDLDVNLTPTPATQNLKTETSPVKIHVNSSEPAPKYIKIEQLSPARSHTSATSRKRSIDEVEGVVDVPSTRRNIGDSRDKDDASSCPEGTQEDVVIALNVPVSDLSLIGFIDRPCRRQSCRETHCRTHNLESR